MVGTVEQYSVIGRFESGRDSTYRDLESWAVLVNNDIARRRYTTISTIQRKAETLIGLRTAAELPSLNRYATRYFVRGLSTAILLPGAPFAVPEAFGTIGRPKKSTATCSHKSAT